MATITVTLMNRQTNAVIVVVERNYRGQAMSVLHAKILKQHPGYFIRKSIRK